MLTQVTGNRPIWRRQRGGGSYTSDQGCGSLVNHLWMKLITNKWIILISVQKGHITNYTTSLKLQDLKPGGGLRLSARHREHLNQSPNERMEWETTQKGAIKLLNHVKEFFFIPIGALRTPARPHPYNMYMREGIQYIHSPLFSTSKSWGNYKRQKGRKN